MRKIHLNILLLFLIPIILAFSFGKELISDLYSNNTKDKVRKVIAVSTIGATHGWPIGVLYHAREEIKMVAKENDWDYICVVAQDSNEQSSQIIDLVKRNVDCIIMLPMDGASLKTAAKTVQDANIPLLYLTGKFQTLLLQQP